MMGVILPTPELIAAARWSQSRIQSVAHPLSDGSQPAGEANSSRRTLLAAPFPQSSDGESAIEHADSEHPSAEHVSPPASQAILGSDRANVGERHEVTRQIDMQTFDIDMTGKTSLAAREGEQVAAPFPTPQASSSQAAGTSALSAHDLGALPPLFEDPCLSAQLAMGIR